MTYTIQIVELWGRKCTIWNAYERFPHIYIDTHFSHVYRYRYHDNAKKYPHKHLRAPVNDTCLSFAKIFMCIENHACKNEIYGINSDTWMFMAKFYHHDIYFSYAHTHTYIRDKWVSYSIWRNSSYESSKSPLSALCSKFLLRQNSNYEV